MPPTIPPATAAPSLVLKPDFAGGLDFELEAGGRRYSRLALSGAGSDEIPALYAELFEDPLTDPDETERLVVEWLEHARPAPRLRIRTEAGELPASIARFEIPVAAGLHLDHDGRTVTIRRTLDHGRPFLPIGASLAFLEDEGRLVRIANPEAWRPLLEIRGLELAVAPVTRGGTAFAPARPMTIDLDVFNEVGLPLSAATDLRHLGHPTEATGTAVPLAIEIGRRPEDPGHRRIELRGPRSVSARSPQLRPGRAAATPDACLAATPSPPGWERLDLANARAALRWWHETAAPTFVEAGEPTPTTSGRDDRAATGVLAALRVPDETLRAGLATLYHQARRLGIDVRWSGLPIGEVDLESRVAATSAEPDDRDNPEQIDWFELRPEVTCDGFRLSDAEWHRILSDGLFMPSDRGHDRPPRIVRRASLDRLRRLDDALRESAAARRAPAPRDSRDDVRIRSGHLRVLDWLNLARAGIELDLPPSDRAVVESLLGRRPLDPPELPAFLNASLRPYQEGAYRWLAFLYRHRFGAVLADDMGLGKTLQTIAFLAGLREGRITDSPPAAPHLVVLPPTLVFNWAAEIQRFYPRFRVVEFTGPRRRIEDLARADLVLTTYDIVRVDHHRLARTPFEVVVFDEAQAVKTWRSSRARAARRIRARFVLCLTGTPLENHLGEFFSIVDLALPGLLGDQSSFLDDVGDDAAHPRVARAQPFLLRRTRDAILPELPPRIESDVPLELTDSQKELYTRTVAEVRAEVAEAFARQPKAQAGIAALAALTKLRQVCLSPALLTGRREDRGPKISRLVASLTELASRGHAALVFSQFTRALDLVEEALREAGLSFLRLDGRTPRPERARRVEAFQHPDGPTVFLISLKTGAAGLNLTRARDVFHLDPWWNPAVENQASARAHRFGQTATVHVHRLLMRHTVEEKMVRLKARKQALYDRLMEPATARGSRTARGAPALDTDDFSFLLDTA